jgi:hypothetical protein
MELLAYSLILQGRPAEAEQWARQAIDRHAVSKVNLDGKQQTLLFQSLMQQGRFDEALSVRPPPSEGSNPLGSTAGALALVVADPMLRRYSRIKAIIEEGDFKKWSSFDRLDQTVLPEVALACGFPRFAFRQYHAYIGQGRVPVLENMVANASSPLWVNEFYQITMRLNAARAAVRAADDPMREPANISPEDRKLARQQGLAWLRLELDSLQRRANQRSEQTRANGILSFLQRCPDFASVREAPSLVKMPEDDRRNWDEFWAKVDALRTTVRYRDPPG